jgi:hypothetical protein
LACFAALAQQRGVLNPGYKLPRTNASLLAPFIGMPGNYVVVCIYGSQNILK